jgi:hypothetical protein
MNKIIISLIMLGGLLLPLRGQAQEKFGRALNLGLGVGYHSYLHRGVPAFILNYELDVARNFTLAPFVGFYSYSYDQYWGNKNYPYRYYTFRETVIPVGAKGTYYFDELLKASEKWDFYAAASLGFAFSNGKYDADFYGEPPNSLKAAPLYVALHIGSEYHLNSKIGFFLDLSDKISSIGISIHH